jgi:ERCC4-type nuclease
VQLRVVVDIYERESRVREALHDLGVDTTIRRLPIADYSAGGALIERKSVRDLHLSIIKGRFWRQVRRLRRGAVRPYVLVEGDDLDAGPLRPESVRGAIIALAELGIPVLRARDPEETATWLKLLAARPYRKRNTLDPLPVKATPAEAMLAAIPGISVVTARSLLERFGTIADIAAASPESWLSAPGVGPVRAQRLDEALRQAGLNPSCPRSGQPGPST